MAPSTLKECDRELNDSNATKVELDTEDGDHHNLEAINIPSCSEDEDDEKSTSSSGSSSSSESDSDSSVC